MENKVPDKIIEKVRKLLRLQDSASRIGSEGEAHAAASAVHRLMTEYNLSLCDIHEEKAEEIFKISESSPVSYKDVSGNIWKRDLLRVLCEYNYCRMLLYSGTTHMVVVGTQENTLAVIVLFNYLRVAFKRLSEERYSEHVKDKRGYHRTKKFKKTYIRSYLEGFTPGLRSQLEKTERSSQETGLMLCHQKLIGNYMDTLKMVNRKPVKLDRKIDYDAYWSGMTDGKNINLNKQIDI